MKKYVNGQYIEMTSEEISKLANESVADKIQQLKTNLAETDYIACKIAEGVATKEEYADIIEQRQLWRSEINELERQEAVT
jgi:hypothetical protein